MSNLHGQKIEYPYYIVTVIKRKFNDLCKVSLTK